MRFLNHILQLAVVPLVTQPCERIKVLLQTQAQGASPSQLDCLKEVIKRDGIINGLYRYFLNVVKL